MHPAIQGAMAAAAASANRRRIEEQQEEETKEQLKEDTEKRAMDEYCQRHVDDTYCVQEYIPSRNREIANKNSKNDDTSAFFGFVIFILIAFLCWFICRYNDRL